MDSMTPFGLPVEPECKGYMPGRLGKVQRQQAESENRYLRFPERSSGSFHRLLHRGPQAGGSHHDLQILHKVSLRIASRV